MALIIVYGLRERFNIILWQGHIQLFQKRLFRRLVFPPKNFLSTFVKNQFAKNIRVYYQTLVYGSIQIDHTTLVYCSFVVSSNIKWFESSNFVLLFQDFLATLVPLKFYMGFWIGLSISAKRQCRFWEGLYWISTSTRRPSSYQQ